MENNEIEASRNDGTSFFVSQNAQFYYDENDQVLGTETLVRDITERKKAEEALKKSEENYRHLLNYAPTAIYEIDFKGPRFKSVNEALISLSGYTREELVSMNPLDILDSESKVRFMNRIKRGLAGKKIDNEVEYQVMHKDGRKFWVILNNKPIYKDGKIIGALVVGHDITERKKTERIIETTISELRRSNEELERFAYVSSHDLQEPLRMVTLYSQLLERRYKDSLDDDADDFIGYIVENAKRMKKLIDDLLEYSRVTSQAKEFKNVNVEKTLDIVLANLSVSIAENNIKVIHEPLPTVFADENQMLQVFQNLITNAIKFRGEKPPEINITAQKGTKGMDICN